MSVFASAERFVAVAVILLGVTLVPGAPAASAGDDEFVFITDTGRDLRDMVDAGTRRLLKRASGVGARFGARQKARYCSLKKGGAPVQWVVNDLYTGEVIARSANAGQLYFGASVSKLFVAAAFLDKHRGEVTQEQLRDLVRMIVVSDNPSWKSLQRQTGADGTGYSGRLAVQAFVQRMGYPTIKGFQGWIEHEDGTREHGNELNALELSRFLHDTYMRRYHGADILWEIMRATRTGRGKIDKYTPGQLYLGGKTGTYSGTNESPETIDHPSIGARNHAVVLYTDDGIYGISVLTNTASSEDVAILGGGLMREYLGVQPAVAC